METIIPLFFALGVGFTHAFEADHLIAISNIITKRSRTKPAIKDGIYWGMGHTSTIIIIGCVIILGAYLVNEALFSYLEGLVGFLLIVLGVIRLKKLKKTDKSLEIRPSHRIAYGVGLVHGLAGSGAVVLLALAEAGGVLSKIFYLFSFGAGSILGMLMAAGLFSLPFTKQIPHGEKIRVTITLLSSVLCIVYGAYILSKIL